MPGNYDTLARVERTGYLDCQLVVYSTLSGAKAQLINYRAAVLRKTYH